MKKIVYQSNIRKIYHKFMGLLISSILNDNNRLSMVNAFGSSSVKERSLPTPPSGRVRATLYPPNVGGDRMNSG